MAKKMEFYMLEEYSNNTQLTNSSSLRLKAGILDVPRHGEREARNIGRHSFLPASFIGGPRDMRQRYMDAITLVQNFGKPDIFLTMTCNPSWPEIEEHLLVTDELQNRPDLISRVFRAKVEEMKIDILKRNIFGKVAAFVYTIEFQKHGLPHAHFLIILNNEYKLLTPEAYDKFVCAELPESDKNDYLYSLVTKHMMHGPCGSLNPKCPCMKNREYCKFKYPKEFTNHTYKGKNGYPIYRRRNNETKLNDDQRKAYDIILDRIFKNKCGAFFIDGPGGTGKTFLYRALLATVRSKGFVALATATSGVAASILSDGRTAHSHFKFPVDIDEHFSCNISKQSSLASLIRDAKLIVWDEVSMAKKQLIEAFDLLLKDLMDTKTLFGGKVVVFGGDFRQTLPVVRSEKKKDFLRESLLCFEIWNQLEKLRLSINMRARTDPAFSDYLMRIESGKEKLNYQEHQLSDYGELYNIPKPLDSVKSTTICLKSSDANCRYLINKNIKFPLRGNTMSFESLLNSMVNIGVCYDVDICCETVSFRRM
ncbi:uncharacterized protein [Nicotiana sylvestris]|uniref:uncharacterized protein n=1 Tax=Nicotiana sylvestris TaxID=4096 RepID=UPI00388CE358